jgi:L1 cell adhesion molecule like protein
MEKEKENIAIGIDLGTTYSSVAVWKNNKVVVIPNEVGELTTPSVVSFTNKERLIGKAAINQIYRNIKNTVYDAKRLIGRLFDDKIVQDDMKHWPFKVVKCPQTGKPKIQVNYLNEVKTFYPEEISSMVLQKLKQTAKDYLGTEVVDAVVTVPAYFNDSQRQATKDAGRIAGLNVLRIINEPTAAAVAYGIEHKNQNCNVLIFDLGGGTFDVSILSLDGSLFEVRSTCGDTHLGGEDFDNVLCNICCDAFMEKYNIDIRKKMNDAKGQKAYRRLKVECEKAKRNLSSSVEVTIDIDALYDGNDLNLTISRPDFEYKCTDLFKKLQEPLDTALKDAKLEKNQINDVILVGGSTRIPKVQEIVKNVFGEKVVNKQINADEAVAIGAAIQAAIMNNVEDDGLEKLILLDITPLSLGTDVTDDVMSVIIPKNTTVPCKETQEYFTVVDEQKSMGVKIVQGERKFCADNQLLGNFTLPLATRGPKGTVKASITFEVDINAILTVTAVEKGQGGNEKSIKIDNLKDRLSEEDIQRLIEDAKKYESYDLKRKKDVQAKTKLQEFAFDIKKKYPNNNKAVNKADEIIKWIKQNPELDAEVYNSKYDELQKLI